MAFEGVDYLGIDTLLTEEQRLIRDTVRSWVEDKVLPVIEDAAYEGRFPKELIPDMAEMHLFGSTLSDYGLPGLDNVAYGLIMQELERGDSGLRSFVSRPVRARHVPDPRLRFAGAEGPLDPGAREREGDRLLRPDRAGLRLEPRRDADDREEGRRRIRLERRQGVDHERLDRGRRRRVGEARRRRSAGSSSRRERPGSPPSSTRERCPCAPPSRRSSPSRTAASRPTNVLPGVQGIKGPLSCLTQARYGISWGAIGSAMATYQAALDYAKSRKQWRDRPIAAHQLVQERLAWMITEITKGQLLAWKLATMKDAGTMKPHHVSMAKRNNVWVARECAKLARETLGANGVVNEYPVFRHLANIESVYTYEGTHDIHTLVIGEAVTGIPSYNPPME